MRARVGDWLVIPAAPHEHHERRGLIVEVAHPDGLPPYRVRWLEDEHVSIVFPPPDAHLLPAGHITGADQADRSTPPDSSPGATRERPA